MSLTELFDALDALEARSPMQSSDLPPRLKPQIDTTVPISEGSIEQIQRRIRNMKKSSNDPWNDMGEAADAVRKALAPDSHDVDRVSQLGLEALAWYSPFHFYPEDWGITIRCRGIEILAEELMVADPTISVLEALALSEDALLRHELGHYEIELAASTIEITQQKPLYVAEALSRSSWVNSAEGYCNQLAHRKMPAKRKKALGKAIASRLPGYSDWKRHKPEVDIQSWGEVMGDITIGKPISWAPRQELKNYRKLVPIRYIQDGQGPSGWPLGH